MAEIKPFRALVYNVEKVGDMTKVVAPPYDVIPPGLQDRLYSRNEFNVVRLILGKTTPDDSAGNDRYSRAAAELKRWVNAGVLRRDKKPAIYYYIQRYRLSDGGTITRKGFMALSRIEELGQGKIHAHERTLSGPKVDRLKLMEACNANFSCIFSLYSEPHLTINKLLDGASGNLKPIIDVYDDDGVENVVFRIDDPEIIKEVTSTMRDKTLFIADGHHRYETALKYREIMRERSGGTTTGTEPYNYVMMYFSNMEDSGMTVWPTHRVVHSVKDFDADSIIENLKKHFNIRVFQYNDDNMDEIKKTLLSTLKELGESTNAFGMHIAGRDIYYILTIKSTDVLGMLLGDAIPDVYKNLDVTVLHELILSNILGINRGAQERQENIRYVKSFKEAFDLMKDNENQIVFLLNPTRVEQVKAVAEAGMVMPQKSTYFYPKLLSGLVLNLLADETDDIQVPSPAVV